MDDDDDDHMPDKLDRKQAHVLSEKVGWRPVPCLYMSWHQRQFAYLIASRP
jgi:hypothetical protein